jgi:hypothetical protein
LFGLIKGMQEAIDGLFGLIKGMQEAIDGLFSLIECRRQLMVCLV